MLKTTALKLIEFFGIMAKKDEITMLAITPHP